MRWHTGRSRTRAPALVTERRFLPATPPAQQREFLMPLVGGTRRDCRSARSSAINFDRSWRSITRSESRTDRVSRGTRDRRPVHGRRSCSKARVQTNSRRSSLLQPRALIFLAPLDDVPVEAAASTANAARIRVRVPAKRERSHPGRSSSPCAVANTASTDVRPGRPVRRIEPGAPSVVVSVLVTSHPRIGLSSTSSYPSSLEHRRVGGRQHLSLNHVTSSSRV